MAERVQMGTSNVGLAINPDRTKVMKPGKWQDKMQEVTIEEAEDFFYLESVLTSSNIT